MLVVERNQSVFNWSIGGSVKPLEYGGDLVIAIDPSKTNMAVLFGTPTGDVLNIFEFSGNNRGKGPVMDTTMYCAEVRSFLQQYLKNANLYLVAVEQAIMKKGQNHYHSSMVLTEIRSNILNFFLEEFGIKVLEINNWSWKSHCLPKGYRSHNEKGSKRYFVENFPESPYSYYYEADVTDCVCIYQYVIDTNCKGYLCMCNRVEPALREYKYYYTSVHNEFTESNPKAVYNGVYSVKENLDFYVNRMLTSFYMDVPASKIDAKDVYGKTVVYTAEDMPDDLVRVVVIR